jgi:uncharacterized integral membrane protein
MSNAQGPGDVESEYPEKPLGGMTIVWLRRVLLAGVLLDIVVAIFVVIQVPIDTTVSYTRVSREWQMPLLVLLIAPLVLISLWWRSRRAASESLPRRERRFLLVIFVPFWLFFTVGQFFMARNFLIAGGVL